MGALVHHDTIGGAICPVAALARRIANLHRMELTCWLSMVCHPSACAIQVLDQCITVAVRWAATFNCHLDKGYTLDGISSSHSLQAGRAMAMKLSGSMDSTIMEIGWWTSWAYLTYIHSQIGALSTGVAWKMSREFTFQNIG
jgi:hypothetical protein